MQNQANANLHKMDRADRVLKPVFTFFSWFAIIAVLVIAVITVVNVFSRMLFSHSLLGSIEIPQMALVIVAFGALPVVSAFNGHIKVDLVVEKFSPGGQKVMTVLNLLLSGTMLIILARFTFIKAAKAVASGISTTSLHIPHWPFYYAMAIFMVFAGLCCYYDIIHLLVDGTTLTANTFDEAVARLKEKKQTGGAE